MAHAGQRVGEYILVDKIGVGAFGEVWRAHHHAWIEQVVAVKIATDSEYVRNLQKQEVAIRNLVHPNVVRALGCDPFANPPYLILEHVPGMNLRPFIRGRKLSIVQAIEVQKSILSGLKFAHEHHVLHLDLKPENVLIHERAVQDGFGREGMVRLTDFAASATAGITANESIVLSHSLSIADEKTVGTLAYLAPEQRDGKSPDQRADIYACGIMLYEMLTGERPAGTDLPSDINPNVPKYLDKVFQRAYSRWDKRFASAEEFLIAVSDINNMQTSQLPPSRATEPPLTTGSRDSRIPVSPKNKPIRTHDRWLALASVAVLVGWIGSARMMSRPRQTDNTNASVPVSISSNVVPGSVPTVLDGSFEGGNGRMHVHITLSYGPLRDDCSGTMQITLVSTSMSSQKQFLNRPATISLQGSYRASSSKLRLTGTAVSDEGMLGTSADAYSSDLTISSDGRTFSGTARRVAGVTVTGSVLDALPIVTASPNIARITQMPSDTEVRPSVQGPKIPSFAEQPKAPVSYQRIGRPMSRGWSDPIVIPEGADHCRWSWTPGRSFVCTVNGVEHHSGENFDTPVGCDVRFRSTDERPVAIGWKVYFRRISDFDQKDLISLPPIPPELEASAAPEQLAASREIVKTEISPHAEPPRSEPHGVASAPEHLGHPDTTEERSPGHPPQKPVVVPEVPAIPPAQPELTADQEFMRAEDFARGNSVAKDPAQAWLWYQKSASHGNAKAQERVGVSYMTGNGVEKNYTEGLKWLNLAAQQQVPVAEEWLGSAYSKGYGVAVDLQKARKWYVLAAEHGNRQSAHNVGAFYMNGTGVQKNPTEAAKWFTKAAEAGLPDSQYILGRMYYDGNGVRRDVQEGLKWVREAAQQGHSGAKQFLAAISKR